MDFFKTGYCEVIKLLTLLEGQSPSEILEVLKGVYSGPLPSYVTMFRLANILKLVIESI
jgi:hypothetical protein